MAAPAGMTEPNPQAVLQLWQPDLNKQTSRRHPLSSQAELRKAMERKLMRTSSSITSSDMASVTDIPSYNNLFNPTPWAEPASSLLSPTTDVDTATGYGTAYPPRRSSQIQIEIQPPSSFQRSSAGQGKGGLSKALSQASPTQLPGIIATAVKQRSFCGCATTSLPVARTGQPSPKLDWHGHDTRALVHEPTPITTVQPGQLKLPDWAQGMDSFGFVPPKPCNDHPTSLNRTSPVTCCTKAHRQSRKISETRDNDKSVIDPDASSKLYDIMATKEYSPGVSPTHSQGSYEEHHLSTPMTQKQLLQLYQTRHTISSIPMKGDMVDHTTRHGSCSSNDKPVGEQPSSARSQVHVSPGRNGSTQSHMQINSYSDHCAHSTDSTSAHSSAELASSNNMSAGSLVQAPNATSQQQSKNRQLPAQQRSKQKHKQPVSDGVQRTWLFGLFGMLDNALSAAVGDSITISNSNSKGSAPSASAASSEKKPVSTRGTDAINWRMRC